MMRVVETIVTGKSLELFVTIFALFLFVRNNIEDKGAENDRGRENYKPWFVTGRNSASNIGIAHIISHVYNAIQHVHGQNRYSFAKMDINLFVKFCRFFLKFSIVYLL